jgi:hypothetical protein
MRVRVQTSKVVSRDDLRTCLEGRNGTFGEGTIVKRRSRQVRRSSRETTLEVWTLTLILDILTEIVLRGKIWESIVPSPKVPFLPQAFNVSPPPPCSLPRLVIHLGTLTLEVWTLTLILDILTEIVLRGKIWESHKNNWAYLEYGVLSDSVDRPNCFYGIPISFPGGQSPSEYPKCIKTIGPIYGVAEYSVL